MPSFWPSGNPVQANGTLAPNPSYAQLKAFYGFTDNDYSDFLQWLSPPAIAPQNVYSNPGVGVSAPNAGIPVVTTKNPDGSTATAHGQVPNSMCVINNPA